MKIKHKLTLRYAGVTAIILSSFILLVFLFSEHTREREFFRHLTRESVTKANLYFSGITDAHTLQSIYHNNKAFIDETELAIYSTDFRLIYHDAKDIDIIKETPELIKNTVKDELTQFYIGKSQGVAIIFKFNNTNYVVTAAAYDGYGYAKLRQLVSLLVFLWIIGLGMSILLGYLLAHKALKPINRIIDDMDIIEESNLHTRLIVRKEYDELDELSDTFNKLLNRLEQSFNNQRMFISNVAHELRTPLAAIIAELEIALLREQRSEKDYRLIIDNTLGDAKSIKHLLNGLLDMAKAGYDHSRISTELLRLDELLLDAREIVLKANSHYSVELIFEQNTNDDTVITVRGNAYLLRTAFVNLIENNCKFSDNHTSIVQISFFEGNTVIRFSDNGCGIPIDEIDKIFIPFYRANNIKNVKGAGIGLPLTQKIIHLHKGSISVHSKQEEGTTFVIKIPHIKKTI